MLTVGVLQGLAAGSLLHVTFYEVLHVLHVTFYEVLYVLHVLHVLHFTFYEVKSLPSSLPLKRCFFQVLATEKLVNHRVGGFAGALALVFGVLLMAGLEIGVGGHRWNRKITHISACILIYI